MGPLFDLFRKHLSVIADDAPRIAHALDAIGRPTDLSLQQALTLYVLALELQPDLIIELGRGTGNSTATFLIAAERLDCRIESFDLTNRAWKASLGRLGQIVGATASGRLNARVEDLAACDFSPIVSGAKRVFVFWDAHGYVIADAVLAKLLPLLGNRPHLIVCHDISDARYAGNGKSYDGLPLWRGMDEWYLQQTAYLRLGWAMGLVDQIVPITDFCSRNEIALRSADHEIIPYRERQDWREVVAAVPALDALPYSGPAWFALEGSGPWHFPDIRVATWKSGLPALVFTRLMHAVRQRISAMRG
jgi:hypothetical protein